MSMASQDGDGFEDIPALDDEWVRKAAKREESAAERSARLRRIAAEHQRLQQQQEVERQTALARNRRDSWRPWIIAAAIIGALILVFIIL
jgi:hypothetical protein